MPFARLLRRAAPTLAAAACLAAAPAARGGAQQINTGTPPAGTEGGQVLRYTPFFAGQEAQTFVAPAGATTLTRFQFWAQNDASNFQLLGFRAHLYTWDDALRRPGATALWSGAVVNGTAAATPQAFTFAVPDFVLTPGQRYAAVLSPLGTPLPPPGTTWQGVVFHARGAAGGPPASTYADGAGYVLQTARAEPLSALSASPWTALSDGRDYAFTATFAAARVVPEPGTLASLGAGLAALGLGGAARRRRSPTAPRR